MLVGRGDNLEPETQKSWSDEGKERNKEQERSKTEEMRFLSTKPIIFCGVYETAAKGH